MLQFQLSLALRPDRQYRGAFVRSGWHTIAGASSVVT